MTNEYELADNSREKLIYEKQDLLAPLLPGMALPPHSMVAGTTAKDYYDGRISGATPEQEAEVEAREAAEAAAVVEADEAVAEQADDAEAVAEAQRRGWQERVRRAEEEAS